MTRSSLLWGLILLLVGTLLLFSSLGIVTVEVWSAVLSVVLIVLGVRLLLRVAAGPGAAQGEEVSIPLGDVIGARVHVRHGAGRLRIGGSASPGALLEGTFWGGVSVRRRRRGDEVQQPVAVERPTDAQAKEGKGERRYGQRRGDEVEVGLEPRGLPGIVAPWNWGDEGFGWSFGLNSEIPLTLRVETGASEVQLDLTDLRLSSLRIQTGASSVRVALPARAGYTRARIEAGAASLSVNVPSEVAARVRCQGALASVDIDRSRFPRSGGVYQSVQYAEAENTIDIDVEAGLGSIRIR